MEVQPTFSYCRVEGIANMVECCCISRVVLPCQCCGQDASLESLREAWGNDSNFHKQVS